MKEIHGETKNIRTLLDKTKFSLDYYQREYLWEAKQVHDLLDDLCGEFLEHYREDHERSAVARYEHYFLGSIIISNRQGEKFIIDGQQRLSTLTLLLTHIYRQLQNPDEKRQIATLIVSPKFGEQSFNLNVQERIPCMAALFHGKDFPEQELPESVHNILQRYQDIENHFPESLLGKALPYFADWLIEKVCVVEITATTDTDAYQIFATMNDRGFPITPIDMLKGYLLANIRDMQQRNQANDTWRNLVDKLRKINKDEDASAIKSWLRGQYARTLRTKRAAAPEDYALIGNEFHRWVRNNKESLGLRDSADFFRFIEEDFLFYGGWHERIRPAAEQLTEGLEGIRYNARNIYNWQYPVYLAALARTDSEEEALRKLRIVSTFLDILVTRRLWNWYSINVDAMQNYIFHRVILKIRAKSATEQAAILTALLREQEETINFNTNKNFYLIGRNGVFIRNILARITSFLEAESGQVSQYEEYLRSDQYDIEHIWSIQYEPHKAEFQSQKDFAEYRNHIGGLLLLEKTVNISLSDRPYEEKLNTYRDKNLLAASLHEDTHNGDTGFQHFLRESELPFKPHKEFKKADLDARQALYGALAEKIWDPAKITQELNT